MSASHSHRPWPPPPNRWILSQRWCNLLFAHWPVPKAALRPLVPERLGIDTFEGEAWIAVVPFCMEAVRPRWLPAVPWLSAFPELNVRTYVILEDRPGVFFFSLDASNPVAVSLARRWFSLPYLRARMRCRSAGDAVAFDSLRAHRGAPAARFAGRYGPAAGVFHAAPGSLEHFLTERYCFYASPTSVGRTSEELYRAEVDHAPWPLQPAEATIEANSLLDPIGLESAATRAPHLLFARSLQVKAWPPRRV